MQQSDITLTTPSSAPATTSKELQKLLARYEDWRYMAQMSRDSPKEMMAVLIQAGDFVITRDWARLHCLPPDLMMVRLLLLLLLHNSVATFVYRCFNEDSGFKKRHVKCTVSYQHESWLLRFPSLCC